MAYPKRAVTRPSALHGHPNGRLPDSILEDIPGKNGEPTIRLLKDTAARSWKAMAAHALRDGIFLSSTSLMDSYRPYEVQVRIFKQRYSLVRIVGRSTRVWNGRTYWQRPYTAAAAVPGTSNHGDAIAVDNKNTTKPAISWLLVHAEDYGWSWELDSEKWHIRYFPGDKIPQAVLDFEASINMEDEMLVGFDKSPEDVARAKIREKCDIHWGKQKMSVTEQSELLKVWKDNGREAMMTKLLDDAQNKV